MNPFVIGCYKNRTFPELTTIGIIGYVIDYTNLYTQTGVARLYKFVYPNGTFPQIFPPKSAAFPQLGATFSTSFPQV